MIRLGLVGYGRIAPRHIEVFRALGCNIVAACNRSEAGCRRAKEEGGIGQTYRSIPEMLEKEALDGILCCVSAEQIFETGCALIPSKIPILLEKPPGLSVEEAETLHERARESGTPVMVALNRRHYSVLRRAIDDAGGMSAINAVFVDWSENPRYLLDQRRLPPHVVERMVFANSLHGLDLLTFLAGAVETAQVLGRPVSGAVWLADDAAGSRERGVYVSFRSTWDAPGGWSLAFTSTGRRYTFAPLNRARNRNSMPRHRALHPTTPTRNLSRDSMVRRRSSLT